MKLYLISLSLCFVSFGAAAVYADTPAAKPTASAAAPSPAPPAKPADSDDSPQKTYPAQASVAAKGNVRHGRGDGQICDGGA